MHSRFWRTAICSVMVVFLGVGVARSADGKGGQNPSAAYEEMERVAEAMLLIRRHYVEERPYGDILSGALKGMLYDLDPYCGFLSADDFSGVQEENRGEYGGIGIHVGVKDGLLTVIAPIEDTPADQAGLQSGDKILKIDDVDSKALTLDEAVARLRGTKGSNVRLTILRLNRDQPQEVSIVRDRIEVSSVKGACVVAKGIGYVRITQFTKNTARALSASMDTLEKENIDALVLDLRDNPGGLLSSAIDVAGQFLKRGVVVVKTRGRLPQHSGERTAEGEGPDIDIRLAVLINAGSASASEIVAGAMQDHHRAVLVGDATFGKASVQSIIPLRVDATTAIRLTTARYYTPKGREIHGKGLAPDIRVRVSPDEWRRVRLERMRRENPGLSHEEERSDAATVSDHQLQRAVEVLQALRIYGK